jgi:hypothetical protein
MYERYSRAKPAERKELDASKPTFVRVRIGSTPAIHPDRPGAAMSAQCRHRNYRQLAAVGVCQ